ncbi:MAG: hypothetical protein GY715_03230 [Planctomycetes bacterium]|nr:hypothetical protein [Planctomycetota bacterium]
MTRYTIFACAVLALALSSVAHAGPPIFVNGGCGSNAWSGVSPICVGPDGPKATIQAGIDAQGLTGQVNVAAGTYNEAIDFLGKEITVIGTAGAASTILDGNGLDLSIVTFNSGETITSQFIGFTLRNGEGTNVEIFPQVFQRFGGALLCDNESSPNIESCLFQQNQPFGVTGGAVANIDGSGPTFLDCHFSNNDAGVGGAVANSSSSGGVFRFCTFISNDAQTGAGMANSGSSSPEVTNCLFYDNVADVSGGAMHNSLASSPTVVNCTVVENTALVGFGGGFFNSASNPVITSCVVWGNTDQDGTDASAQIHVSTGGPTVSYCCVLGGWFGAGGNNVSDNPIFVNPGANDFRLDDFSPAIDAGDNAAVPAGVITDLDTLDRFINDEGVTDLGNGAAPLVDMGAYERQANSESTFVLVPGHFGTIQEGINAAAPAGAEIVVSPGTYFEQLNTLGKAVNLHVAPGPGSVIVDGGGSGDVITIDTLEGPTTILEGLTIRGGGPPGGSGIHIDGASPTVRDCLIEINDGGLGGGIHVTNLSNPIIDDCTFNANTAGLGGGIYIDGQSLPTITDCDFLGNIAGIGGAIYVAEQSDGSITDCLFEGNTAIGSGLGGAVFSSDSSAHMLRCTFLGNNAINGGALLLVTSSSPNVYNCFFAGNDADNNGGAIATDTASFPVIANCLFTGNRGRFGGALSTGNEFESPSVRVVGCTFSNNIAENQGGSIYMGGGDVLVVNSILWQNTPDEIYEIFSPPGVTAIFSDVQGGWPGTANLNINPMFIDPDGPDNTPGTLDDNFRVPAGSPVIGAGNDFFIPPGADIFDLDGNPRVVGTVDMGCYELPGPPPACPADLNGNGDVDFADILVVIGAWGCVTCPDEDLNNNGTVDFADILFIIGMWGPCPP